MPKMEIEITEVEPDDTLKADIAYLLKGALSHPKDLSWLEWKHEQSPFGKSKFFLAHANGQLVGVRIFMPWQFHGPSGEKVTFWRPVDTATHVDFRGQGIFKKLTLHGLKVLFPDQDFRIFNTPNSNSLPGYLKMGWKLYPYDYPYYYGFGFFGKSKQELFYGKKLDEVEFFPVHEYSAKDYETAKSKQFLSWRYGASQYRFSGFMDGSALLVYTKAAKLGRPVVLVKDYFGPVALKPSLIKSTCAAEGCQVFHMVQNKHEKSITGLKYQKGNSDVAVLIKPESQGFQFFFSAGDLEGVM